MPFNPIKKKDSRRKALTDAFSKQRGKCCWCGVQMKLPKADEPLADTTATREHMVPQLYGGTFAKGNIRAACRKCNSERGARMVESMKGRKP